MMTRYALLYERLSRETHQPETVVSYYAENAITTERREIIAAPRSEAEQMMIAQGWRYAKSAGPGSILMQHE